VVRRQRLEEIHAAAPVVGETEALPVERGAAGAEEQVVDADVVAHDLEHRLPVLVHQAIPDPEREAAERRARLMGRHGHPGLVPLERNEVGDLRALEVDHGQVLSGRGGNRAPLRGGHDDGTLPWMAHSDLLSRA